MTDKRRDVRQAEDAMTLGPQGPWSGTGAQASPVAEDAPPAERSDLTRAGTQTKRGKPVALFAQEKEGSRKADQRWCGYGGGKKRMPSCHGTDTSCNMTRRESGQTSLRCLGTRTTEESTKKVLQMTVALLHWCYLPRKGIDCCSVSCSQHVLRMLTGPSHGL